MKDVKVKLEKDAKDETRITFDFPALKHVEVDAHQSISAAVFSSESNVQLKFENFDFDITTGLSKNDDTGYLNFEVSSVIIKFGQSYLYHDNWVVQIVMHQLIYYLIVIFENTVKIFWGTAFLIHIPRAAASSHMRVGGHVGGTCVKSIWQTGHDHQTSFAS